MRLGIMAMQLGLILSMPRQGEQRSLAEAVAGFDSAALVSRLADAGFGLVELNTDLELFLPGAFAGAARRRLAALKDRRGLTYTVHLPLWSVEASTPDENIRQASVATLVSAVERMAELEPEVYVLHPTGALAGEFNRMRLPAEAKALVMGRFQQQARRSLAELLERTRVSPRTVAVENVEYPFDLTLALAEEFDCSLCLDTGHLLAGYSGNGRFEDAVERALPRLAQVHLHDGYLRREGGVEKAADHLALGEGDLPLAWLLDKLTAVNFRGPVVLEVSVAEAMSSVAAIRGLRPEAVGG
ncbi:MAG: cobamide remodeling phosphodiesterase CbiR [Dehalococcoidales bacterium]|nr:cobamide remodeling phosphodiesterase CbiR [Dehalococcoidales bacterium]